MNLHNPCTINCREYPRKQKRSSLVPFLMQQHVECNFYYLPRYREMEKSFSLSTYLGLILTILISSLIAINTISFLRKPFLCLQKYGLCPDCDDGII